MATSPSSSARRGDRLLLAIALLILVPIGYGVRFYSPLPEWLNDALGSVFYELFWTLLALWVWPRQSVARIAIAVFLATCALEVLQLWQPPWLQAMRATLPGRLVLGNTFTWQDFPAYIVGCPIAWWVGRSLCTQPIHE